MVFKWKGFIQSREIKSRRDGILLTVDFNLRTKNAPGSLQSPAGTIQGEEKVSSLRDIPPLIQYFHKFLISRALIAVSTFPKIYSTTKT